MGITASWLLKLRSDKLCIPLKGANAQQASTELHILRTVWHWCYLTPITASWKLEIAAQQYLESCMVETLIRIPEASP